MKIVLLVSSLGAGGAERVATTLCNAWSSRGDTVILVPTFSGGGLPFYKVSESVDLRYLADMVGTTRKSPFSYLKRLMALRGLIVNEQPDVVISFLPNVNVAAIASTFFLSVPVICCERRDPVSQPTAYFWEWACRITYRFADMLVVQTEAASRTIGQSYSGLTRVRTLPNPLPEEALLEKKIAGGGERKTLLSLGRLSEEKQIEVILRIFAKIANTYPDWDLRIYGEGPERVRISSLILEFGLQQRAFLMGRTTSPWSVMASADAFIMTSKYEGFPNALLEAMGVGLPCISYDCPSGPKDITLNGEAAILVPLSDETELEIKLNELMDNELLRSQLGRLARESVISRYSLPSVVAKWDALFAELGVTCDQ